MKFNKNKWVSIAIAIFFAILQTIQPFIHAHVDAEHPIQNTGFHLGNDYEEAHDTEHLTGYVVLNDSHTPHVSQTISVASGIPQDIYTTLFADIMLVAIFSFCIVLASKSTHRLNPAFLLIPKESLKKRLPASRAPPQI
jgi:hypothetical protein